MSAFSSESDDSAATSELTQIVNRMIAARRITQGEYLQVSAVVLADGTVDEQERRQINRLFDAIQNGMVKIVD